MSNYTFTVFTPTYNRENELVNLYNSLLAQTYKNFEWLIVDDGSNDNTQALIHNFISECTKFPIRYFKQTNQGKHVALNKGINNALGCLFVPLDSDDTIVPEALEIFKKIWDLYCGNKNISGISCCCMDHHGNCVGDSYPKSPMISNDINIFFKFRITGEHWGCYLTEILKKYPFPNVDGYKFISESEIWFKIAESYEKVYINDRLRIYKIHSDSLSNIENKIKYGKEYLRFCILLLNRYSNYFKYNITLYFKTIIRAHFHAKNAGIHIFGKNSLIKMCDKKHTKIFISITTPITLLFKFILKK